MGTETTAKIIKLEEELRLAMLYSDVKKLDELIDDSLTFIIPDGKIITKQMDLNGHLSKIQTTEELSPSEQTVQVLDENCAIVTVNMRVIGSYNKIDISGNYRYLRIWKKINQNWKVVAGSVTQII